MALARSVDKAVDHFEEVLDVGWGEEFVGALGRDSGEGGFVDAGGFDGAVFCEVVDHETDKGELVFVVAAFVKQIVERCFRCGPVEAD